jgi:nitrite reductase/ring-hydroxylating ferredoxin subunit
MNDVFVARRDEIPPGGCRVVQVGDKPVAVFHAEGRYFALVDYCSHRAGPLSEGEIRGLTVRCPWHGSEFDLATGKPLCRPAVQEVRTYQVILEGNEIRVRG